jgi:hypothetical protein
MPILAHLLNLLMLSKARQRLLGFWEIRPQNRASAGCPCCIACLMVNSYLIGGCFDMAAQIRVVIRIVEYVGEGFLRNRAKYGTLRRFFQGGQRMGIGSISSVGNPCDKFPLGRLLRCGMGIAMYFLNVEPMATAEQEKRLKKVNLARNVSNRPAI